jgi:hypothetical protein
MAALERALACGAMQEVKAPRQAEVVFLGEQGIRENSERA